MNLDYDNLGIRSVQDADVAYMDDIFLDEEGKLKVVSYEDIQHIPREHLSIFCTKKGFYCLPTTELIDFLKEEIGELKAIEIGSGNGVISKALGIPGTDSFMQAEPDILKLYEAMQQTPVPYGDHVEKADAKEAVRKHKPEVVVAAWVTHKYNPKEHWRGGNAVGINEKLIVERTKKYIHIGNEKVHKHKPVLRNKHRTIRAPWLISRAFEQELNVIYIWE